jgi:hypothetical protein
VNWYRKGNKVDKYCKEYKEYREYREYRVNRFYKGNKVDRDYEGVLVSIGVIFVVVPGLGFLQV